ncbi:unnamed protein product [Aspergillus oryzae]|uniref:Unnamed protein product n=2 Tax=Aspergillus oryzae TaxID=5062 RepID=A0AAN4YPL4_ASPOZ|nr:unnamed protein product [Aspergillus oryzae]GMF86855.1 unnamed protein product [Aspergillus oryzae]GMG06019.1 unnamed protein product [Aspergillus oryzae]GMG31292.1 unnamed protein product [Aspergillus oryzae]GMG44931.1 unnamed protein product [Aspergillus oryzae var. brunneus]
MNVSRIVSLARVSATVEPDVEGDEARLLSSSNNFWKASERVISRDSSKLGSWNGCADSNTDSTQGNAHSISL